MARFDKRWFNPLYFILNDLIKRRSIRGIFVYGGKSSAKTVSISQLLAKEAYVRGASSLAYRKESAVIPTTLKKSLSKAIDSIYLHPACTKLDRKFLFNCESGGQSEIVLKGIDDDEKAKGIESYQYLYLDELNQFTLAEFEQFNLSLRGMANQKIFGTWNPTDDGNYVKVEILDKLTFVDMTGFYLPDPNSFVKVSTCGKWVLIKTTYKDNYWITGRPDGNGDNYEFGFRDDNLIDEYESLRTRNYQSYKVNVLGEWGKTVFGGEFLKCWRSEKHVDDCPYDPKLALYLIFDENVNPYFPCGFFQVGDNQKDIRLVHVLAPKNPNNTVRWIAGEIARKMREWGHTEAVYIGGDPTSQKEDVKQEKGHDLFRLIINELKKNFQDSPTFEPRRAVSKGPPSVKMSADFFNSILEGEIYGLNFRVDKSCRVAITDYENTKEDKNGKVDKSTATDPKTKVSYQPWGHFVDLTRYFLCYTFSKEYSDYQKGGAQHHVRTGRDAKPVSKHGY